MLDVTWLTVAEFADAMKLSADTVGELCVAGRIHAKDLGILGCHYWRIPSTELKAPRHPSQQGDVPPVGEWVTLNEFCKLAGMGSYVAMRRCYEKSLPCRNMGTGRKMNWRIHSSGLTWPAAPPKKKKPVNPWRKW